MLIDLYHEFSENRKIYNVMINIKSCWICRRIYKYLNINSFVVILLYISNCIPATSLCVKFPNSDI